MTSTCSVLLDLDGTLIDSQPGILASCLAALRALGHEPDETLDIKRTIGPPLEDMMQVLLQPYGDNRVGEAAGQNPKRALRRPKSPQQRSDQTWKPVNSEQDCCSIGQNLMIALALTQSPSRGSNPPTPARQSGAQRKCL